MELEKMGDFFDNRLDMYDAHQLNAIDSARIFYPFTAAQLPAAPHSRVLDLGCGTGLELDAYLQENPQAAVTGIDLAPGMLDALRQKHPLSQLSLICGSYFDVPFPADTFDAAVSVESLHHFTAAQKIPLYRKLYAALKADGYFILTDYFAESVAAEQENFATLARLKYEQGLPDGVFYHYDTPLTLSHEMAALRAGGFTDITVLGRWAATATLKICK